MSTLENCKAKITEITDLLHNESVMLSEGRMSDLDTIVSSKATAMASLNVLLGQLNNEQETSIIIPQIQRLQKLAKDNGLILESVMRGVRSAQERLKALQYNDAKVGAYNKAGVKLYLAEDQIQSEKLI